MATEQPGGQERPMMPDDAQPSPTRPYPRPVPVQPEEALALWQGWTSVERRAVVNVLVRCLAGWDGAWYWPLEVFVLDRAAADRLGAAGVFCEFEGEASPRNNLTWKDEYAPPEAIPLWPLERLWSLIAALVSGDAWDFDLITLSWIKKPAHLIVGAPEQASQAPVVSQEEPR